MVFIHPLQLIAQSYVISYNATRHFPTAKLLMANRVHKIVLAIVALSGMISLTVVHPLLAWQTPGGMACVTVYDDTNQNGQRDPGEGAVLNVNVTLSVDSGPVISNHVTDSSEPHCFQNLPPAQYTLTVDSPLYEAVDPTPFTFTLDTKGQINHEFGVKPKPPAPTADDSILNIPLTLPVRLELSSLCTAGAMGTVGGLGLILYGLFIHPRKPKASEPTDDEQAIWSVLADVDKR